jgi:stage IV sporulation protein A
MQALPFAHPLIENVVNEFKNKIANVEKIGDFSQDPLFENSDEFEQLSASIVKMGEGRVDFVVTPKPHIFYNVLSEQCGMNIQNDFELISNIKDLAHAKIEYDKLKDALQSVEETGYGVVNPKLTDMTLDEPAVVKQGNRYGVKLHASAPSLHIMKVDIETDLSPLVGTEAQTTDFVNYLQKEFENNPQALWDTNVLGRSLSDIVSDGIKNKLLGMPIDAQRKMRKTLTKIVNEGKGGIICILL